MGHGYRVLEQRLAINTKNLRSISQFDIIPSYGLNVRYHRAQAKKSKKYIVEFGAETLERLAAACGWFHPEFTASIERAERDITAGRVKKLRSFKDLRS